MITATYAAVTGSGQCIEIALARLMVGLRAQQIHIPARPIVVVTDGVYDSHLAMPALAERTPNLYHLSESVRQEWLAMKRPPLPPIAPAE